MGFRGSLFLLEAAIHNSLVTEPQLNAPEINGQQYLLAYDVQGSGSYLYVWIYLVNEAGRPEQVFFLDNMPSGNLFYRGGRIFVRGGEKRYEVRFVGGRFRLFEYLERFDCDPGDGSHVLSFEPNKARTATTISFDCAVIARLEEGWNEEVVRVVKPLELDLGEIVIVHSLLPAPEPLKILFRSGGILEYRDGLYGSIVATRLGEEEVSPGYAGQWIRVSFTVKSWTTVE